MADVPEKQSSGDKKTKIKQIQHEGVLEDNKFIRFRGAALVEQDNIYRPLTSDTFNALFYKRFPYATVQQIKEVEHLVRYASPDLSHLDHLIQFGDKVWDTKLLDFVPTTETVLRSPVLPQPASQQLASDYLLQLSNGDPELADDYLQGLAPMFMDRKPAGVIWFVGGGANGKSALINAVYKIIGHHLASMTVGAIEDGRDAPRLNGVIGNICRESSEGRVENTERYKCIGTHEPFPVHKFNSQEPVTITTNFHTVFNANNIPVFSDKTEGARRRTLIVPFPAKFKDDPHFEERTFTDEFLGGLLSLILEATHIIRDNYYQYRFSDATIGAKENYDSEVNSAEAFLAHMRENNVRAFTNYTLLEASYQNWCGDHGLVPLGRTSLKRVMTSLALADNSKTFKQEGATRRWYFIDKAIPTVVGPELVSFDNGLHVGLKTAVTEPTAVPEKEQSELGKDW